MHLNENLDQKFKNDKNSMTCPTMKANITWQLKNVTAEEEILYNKHHLFVPLWQTIKLLKSRILLLSLKMKAAK